MRALREQPNAALAAVAILLVLMTLPGVHWLFTVIALLGVSVIAAVIPTVIAALVVLSIPVQSVVMLPFVRGELTVTQLVLFGLIIGWGALLWRRDIWLDSVVVGFLLVLAAYAVSFIAVDSPSLWFQESYRWAVAGVFYVICRSVIRDWRDIRLVLWAMIAGILGVSLYAFWQLLSDAAPQDFLVGGVVRVYGTFGTPNTLAAYMEMTVPMLLACLPLAWFIKGEFQFSTLERWLLALASGVGIVILLVTQSRGGLIGMLGAGLVLWWLLPTKAKLVSGIAGFVLIGGFLLTAPGQSQLDRFMTLQDEVANDPVYDTRSSYDVGAGRGALWAAARVMIAEHPLTGVGAGEFDENYREHVPSWIDRFPRGQAHNVWLQMGAQAGIWGILGYAAWFAASVWSVITARRRVENRHRYWLLTGVLAVFAAYTLHSLVDYLNVLSLGLQLSVVTAIALNLAREPLTRYSAEKTELRIALSRSEVSPCPQ